MLRSYVINSIILCLLISGFANGKKPFGPGALDWAYAEVRPNAHMFWLLFYTTSKQVYQRPLVIWLQGGPGVAASGVGNILEIGPIDLKLKARTHSWIKNYNVLFVDSPVGTGFSYTKNAQYATSDTQVAKDLLKCLASFYDKLPRFKDVPVYIFGQSYGGKAALALAQFWLKAQENNHMPDNLKGVALGNAWISPLDSVMNWAPFLLQTGFVDLEGYEAIHSEAKLTQTAVAAKEWQVAYEAQKKTQMAIYRETKNIDFHNVFSNVDLLVQKTNAVNDELFKLMNDRVKKSLKLPSTWCGQCSTVSAVLQSEFMKPAKDLVSFLLEKTKLKVYVYSGNWDLIVPTAGTLGWIKHINWSKKTSWNRAERKPLVIDGIIEGYKKSFGNFAFYSINRAGHLVPADNPRAAEILLNDLTSS
ncbi:hypothetical protein TKK_0014862 [Trichogramma kaykai]|uniref:Retinoid-inducible serine carboxypeptidase n=1 Tax=Trichogramma kaykai TaxID=54128 RepID=A0ABD2WCJ2_9HYME